MILFLLYLNIPHFQLKYFIKLYITYIIGALAKSGFEKGTEQFKSFMGDAKHKLLQIATAASVDIAEVQNILEEYIPYGNYK